MPDPAPPEPTPPLPESGPSLPEPAPAVPASAAPPPADPLPPVEEIPPPPPGFYPIGTPEARNLPLSALAPAPSLGPPSSSGTPPEGLPPPGARLRGLAARFQPLLARLKRVPPKAALGAALGLALVAGVAALGTYLLHKRPKTDGGKRTAPAPKPQEKGWILARFCPADTVAFLAVRDLKGMRARLGETALGGLWASPELPWLARLGLKGLAASPEARWLGRLADAGSGEAALAMTALEFSEGYQPIPHLLLVMKPAGADPAALEALAADAFAALAADQADLKKEERVLDDGTRIQLLGDSEVTLAYAVRDGMLFAASRLPTLEAALDLGSGKGASLLASPSFKELSGEAGGQAFAFLSTATLWKAASSRAYKEAQASGLTAVDALAFSAELAPPGFHERFLLHTSSPRTGILQILDNAPLPREAFQAPERLQSFSRINLSPARVWDLAMKALTSRMTTTDAHAFQKDLQADNEEAGFRFREDLLQSLGETLTVTETPAEDPLHPDTVLAWALADPARFSECLRKARAAQARMGRPPFPRLTAMLGLPPNFLQDLPLSVGVAGDSLVMANRPELVPEAGKRDRKPVGEEKTPGKPAAPTPLQAALASLPPEAWAVFCSDLSNLPQTLPAQVRDLRRQGIPIPPGLAEALASGPALKNLPPMTACFYNRPRMAVLDFRSPIPAGGVLAAAAALGLGQAAAEAP